MSAYDADHAPPSGNGKQVALKPSQSSNRQHMCGERIRQRYKLASHQMLNVLLQLLVL